jgi:polyisoprenoid-binding protein YceI
MSWAIDTSHTTVEFAVRHLGLASVKGTFNAVRGEAQVDEQDLTKSAGRVEIDVASIDTRDQGRDNHLRSADFFDAEQFPTITFESRRITHLRGERFEVEGDLTIRGISRPVTLQAEVSEFINDPWGNRRAAVSLEGEINRTEWGMTFNQVLEAGRLVVGEKVKVRADAEIVQAAAVAA